MHSHTRIHWSTIATFPTYVSTHSFYPFTVKKDSQQTLIKMETPAGLFLSDHSISLALRENKENQTNIHGLHRNTTTLSQSGRPYLKVIEREERNLLHASSFLPFQNVLLTTSIRFEGTGTGTGTVPSVSYEDQALFDQLRSATLLPTVQLCHIWIHLVSWVGLTIPGIWAPSVFSRVANSP